jgi:hypothetical protein
MSFAAGNAVKYITRYQDKGRPLEDLRKARWYLDQLIKEEEAKASAFDPQCTLNLR